MEEGGPLDQFLMVLISIFSNPWVTGGTTAAVAAAMPFLPGKRRKETLTQVYEAVGAFYTIMFLASCSVKSIPRFTPYRFHFVCPADGSNCYTVIGGHERIGEEYTFLDQLVDQTQGFFVDAAIALVVGAVALFIARRTVGSSDTFKSLLGND